MLIIAQFMVVQNCRSPSNQCIANIQQAIVYQYNKLYITSHVVNIQFCSTKKSILSSLEYKTLIINSKNSSSNVNQNQKTFQLSAYFFSGSGYVLINILCAHQHLLTLIYSITAGVFSSGYQKARSGYKEARMSHFSFSGDLFVCSHSLSGCSSDLVRGIGREGGQGSCGDWAEVHEDQQKLGNHPGMLD